MMTDNFDRALAFVLRWEGGYVDHAGDRGGATNLGVSLRFLKGLPDGDDDGFLDGDLNRDGRVDKADVRLVGIDQAARFYHDLFWRAGKCDDLPWPVDLIVVDTAINCGGGRAGRWLQEAVNSVRVGLPSIVVDSAVGPQTLAAVAGCRPDDLAERILTRRLAHYDRLVRDDPDQGVFIKGWLNRVRDLAAEAGLAGLAREI